MEKFREGAGGSYTGEDVGGDDELGSVSLNIQLWPDPPPCLCVGCFGRCISHLHCYFDFETVFFTPSPKRIGENSYVFVAIKDICINDLNPLLLHALPSIF